nr:retrovirus-related Pol polyprotein from transposon TNT 1-94 [Tanacetum cinerariifolium]
DDDDTTAGWGGQPLVKVVVAATVATAATTLAGLMVILGSAATTRWWCLYDDNGGGGKETVMERRWLWGWDGEVDGGFVTPTMVAAVGDDGGDDSWGGRGREAGDGWPEVWPDPVTVPEKLESPFTSQSSKIVERTHHKLRKMSRAMLDEQSIPQKFWKPSLEYFRVFGCKVFIVNTKVHLIKFDLTSYKCVFLGYSQTSKAYIVLNKEKMRTDKSLNVTFDESLPGPKSSPSVEEDMINEPIVQDLNGSSSLQVNVLDECYPKSIKEARGHLIEQVIIELNKRRLRSKPKQA